MIFLDLQKARISNFANEEHMHDYQNFVELLLKLLIC